MSTETKKRFFRGLLLAVVVVALIAGVTLHAARQADGRLRAALLQQARMVAMTIDPQQVASLTGTEADLAAPGYIRLHERLILVGLSNPRCRFIYLMSRAPDGRVFFTVDSEPADSEDYTPPGEAYGEAPPELHVVFATGQAAVRGPYLDRWGSWISAFVPLTDPATGGMETVLGMDIDAREWKRTIALRAAAPAGLTAIVILLGLLTGGLYRSGRQLRARQAELQESEEKYRLLFDSAGDAIFVHDENMRMLAANTPAVERYGYTRAELMSATIAQADTPDEGALAQERVAKLMKQGHLVFGVVHRRKDGSLIPTEVNARRIVWDGKSAMMSICRDLSERERSEEKARQGHILSKAIIESIPGAFYMVGADGRYVGWNAYQRDEIVGKPESEMTDTYAIDTIHPDDRALVGERIANVLKNGTEEVVEGRVLLRGGPDYRWLLMTGRQMMIKGSPVLIGIGIDITYRKKADERVEASAAEARRLLAETEQSRRTLLSVVEDQQRAEVAIQEQLDELRRWHEVTLGREERVQELKSEVNELLAKAGQAGRYGGAEEKK